MKPLWIVLLLAGACSASIVVDQSQAWFTDGIEFHWILETNYGYEPIDLEGHIVSGLTDGGTPPTNISNRRHRGRHSRRPAGLGNPSGPLPAVRPEPDYYFSHPGHA
jgi:hypothetical protein